MGPKKRDRETESTSKQLIKEETVTNELSAFLLAFEKPTQIYRYLKTRNMISPIFLNRNLSYMKNRMSRSHIKRKTFLVDSMLSKKMRTEKTNGYNWINDHLTMIFLGFYDKNLTTTHDNGGWVKVETILLKISHKKRKDSSSAIMQATVGNSDVPLNPKENVTDKVPAISVPKESFKPLDDPLQLSVILLFRIQYYPSILNGIDEATEPLSKRPKLSSKLYGSELMIFDKQGRCQLTEGDYELNVQEISTQSLNKYNSPKKMSSWEHISSSNLDFYDVSDLTDGDIEELNPFAAFDRKPMLKFRLSWTKESYCGLVDRPRAIVTDPERRLVAVTANCNKENLPETNGHITTTNNNVYSLLNGGAAAAKDANQTTDGKVATFNGLQENGTEKIQLVYQFIYNNNSRQRTEPCQDLHCPWCSLNCNFLYSLLKHLKLCHARFNFNYVPLAKGSARIDVSINEIYDGSYTGSPHDLLLGAKSFSRTGPVQRTSVTNILVCRPRRGIKPSLSEFIELDEAEYEIQRPYITGHNRLYHHTETCLPVHPKELDIDSEGESDPLWLQQKTKQMIDEFTDVNEGEKELMKLWNLHVMKYGYVGDCQIPICISMFLECHGIELLQKNLYRNFVLHMCSLFDFGLISPAQMFAHCQQLASMDCPESRKIITEGREQQREYWRTVGVLKHEQQLLQKQKDQELKSRHRKEGHSDGAKEGGAEPSTSSAVVKGSESKRKIGAAASKNEASTSGVGLKRKISTTERSRTLLSSTLQVNLTPLAITSTTTTLGQFETIKSNQILTRRSTSTASAGKQKVKTVIKYRRKSSFAQATQTRNKRQTM